MDGYKLTTALLDFTGYNVNTSVNQYCIYRTEVD